MKHSEVRDELLAEHRLLRAHVERARQTAERWTHGVATWLQLRDDLAQLADALRDHNLHEERSLRDLVGSSDASRKARDRLMDEAHISEHRDTFDALIHVGQARDPGREGPHLEAFFSRLLGHMAWEEGAFLNATVLGDEGASNQ